MKIEREHLKFLSKYVDDYFPQWKDQDMPQTYIVPPIFTFKDRFKPSKGASNNDPERYNNMDRYHYTRSVEEYVMNVFVRFGDYTKQPMFVFPSFKFESLVKALNELLKEKKYKLLFDLNKEELKAYNYNKETDVIIVHKEYGIILVEIKSNINDYEEAQKQLDKTENLLYNKHLSKYFELDPRLKNTIIRKVIACPCHNESKRKKTWRKAGYIDLFENHIATCGSFGVWWLVNMQSTSVEWWKYCSVHIKNYYESVYCDLVPKLLCNPKIQGLKVNRNFMHCNKNSKEVLGELNLQKKQSQKMSTRFANRNDKVPDFQEIEWNEQQSEAYKIKQQVIYGPYGSGKTILIQYKAAELAFNNDCKVLIILPTECLVIKYKVFFHHYQLTPRKNKIETYVNKTEYLQSDRPGSEIFLVSMDIFNENLRLYSQLATQCHVFVDELLWLPYSPEKSDMISNTIDLIFLLNNGERYLWIAPYLYIIFIHLFTNSEVKEAEKFLKSVSNSSLHITILTTTMRTTKQVHDFIVQKEWQDFCKYINFKNIVHRIDDDVFKSVLCSSHGNYQSGSPVRIFRLDPRVIDHFCEYMVSSRLPHFSLPQLILREVERHYNVLKIKPKDMAVIVDTCTKNHIYIKHKLLNELILGSKKQNAKYTFSSLSDKKFEERIDIVAVCNSDDIASFEWSVVIHVKNTYDRNYRLENSSNTLTYFNSHHNMIASRCTMHYIIICREYQEDAWPHMKSFLNFKLWYTGTNKDSYVKAFDEYLKCNLSDIANYM